MEIRVEELTKVYMKKKKKIEVIKNFNYIFQSGNLYLLKGESGKGKTTLLTLVSLLQRPSSGRVYYDDQLVSKLKNEQQCKVRRDKVGVIFQDYNLLDSITVLENVELLDLCSGNKSRKEIEKKAMEILEQLNMGHRANHFAFELSGGEQQRVGVARALIKEPEILICDEPVSNLDKENVVAIVKKINEYCHKENKICIVASHDASFDSYADQIIYV